jgi:hypothetical protein
MRPNEGQTVPSCRCPGKRRCGQVHADRPPASTGQLPGFTSWSASDVEPTTNTGNQPSSSAGNSSGETFEMTFLLPHSFISRIPTGDRSRLWVCNQRDYWWVGRVNAQLSSNGKDQPEVNNW